ncbi:MAG: AgmX/PglI C-terminal domain-containing protein [Deltaproteobacteria bacterium]|nr:AgmX/PglI C-terminal domain-containing protein [Deltaproteobacteria bacterium]
MRIAIVIGLASVLALGSAGAQEEPEEPAAEPENGEGAPEEAPPEAEAREEGEGGDEGGAPAEAREEAESEEGGGEEGDAPAPKKRVPPKGAPQKGAPAKPAPPPVDVNKIVNSPEFQMASWQAISSSASRIDHCTDRYSTQWPARKGAASVEIEVDSTGSVKKANVTTSLANAHDLTVCLRDVAKSWRFPAVPGGVLKTKLNVPVARKQKFSLLKPGEKPPATQPDEPKPQGFVGFQVGFWND